MKMFVKQLGFTVVLLLSSSLASAATINLGAISGSTSKEVSGVVYWGATSYSAFTDEFFFTLDTDVASLSVSAVGISDGTGFGIQEFTGISMGASDGVVGNVTLSYYQLETANYSTGFLSAGNYSFSISGISDLYTSEYNITVITSPVPEPSAVALMLGGLGLVGFMAARRRNQNA